MYSVANLIKVKTSALQLDLIMYTKKTMLRPLPKVECKGWQNDFFKLALSWILRLSDNIAVPHGEHMLPIREPIDIPL